MKIHSWLSHSGLIGWKGGTLKRSLGMASAASTIPKAYGFEDATQPQTDNLQIHWR